MKVHFACDFSVFFNPFKILTSIKSIDLSFFVGEIDMSLHILPNFSKLWVVFIFMYTLSLLVFFEIG